VIHDKEMNLGKGYLILRIHKSEIKRGMYHWDGYRKRDIVYLKLEKGPMTKLPSGP